MTGRAREVILSRTGLPALRITEYGLCAQASSRAQQGVRGVRETRWHELDLWSADTQMQGPEQRHALAIRYCTQWQGELGHHHAALILRRDLAQALADYDPLAHVTGYPPGEQFAERRARLLRELRAGWEHAVSDLLEQAKVWETGDP